MPRSSRFEIEIPGAALLRQQAALETVGEAADDALEVGELLVEIAAQARELLGIAQILGLDGLVEARVVDHLQGVVGRLANRLQRRLLAQQSRAWDFDLEEGQLGSSVRARMSAQVAATVIGRPRIEPELSSSSVTTVSRKSVSFPAPGRAASPARRGSPAASRPPPAASTTCATSSTRAPTPPGAVRARTSG
jgi:hypothetical protein